jgi:hypothetical protein
MVLRKTGFSARQSAVSSAGTHVNLYQTPGIRHGWNFTVLQKKKLSAITAENRHPFSRTALNSSNQT